MTILMVASSSPPQYDDVRCALTHMSFLPHFVLNNVSKNIKLLSHSYQLYQSFTVIILKSEKYCSLFFVSIIRCYLTFVSHIITFPINLLNFFTNNICFDIFATLIGHLREVDCSLAVVGGLAAVYKPWCCMKGQITTCDLHAGSKYILWWWATKLML